MACYHPNIILLDSYQKQFGLQAKVMKFINSKSHDFKGYEFYEKQNENFKKQGFNYSFEKVPCKWCSGCQEKYSKEWATRCMLEAAQYEHNYFITLTYNENHIPKDDELVNYKTGEIFQNDNWEQGHLEPEDLTRFNKSVREYWRTHFNHTGIKFYASGEYGGLTRRPHYHMIMFNLPIKLEDLRIYKIKNGHILWDCDILTKIWGKGFVGLAEVNWDTCAYTARYVMKKLKGKKSDEQYYEQGMRPEFVRMSRRPGIGIDFFKENVQEIYKNDEIILQGHAEKIQPVKPPEYFDRMFRDIEPERMDEIKAIRKQIAEESTKIKNLNTDLTESERLCVEEKQKLCKWQTLARNAI